MESLAINIGRAKNREMESGTLSLGQKIREQRLKLGLRVFEVAEKSELSSGYISQLERDQAEPSISTLKKLSQTLKIPVGYFFEERAQADEKEAGKERSPVVHEHNRKVLSPAKGVTFYLLNPDLSGQIEVKVDVFEPGASTSEEIYSHPGEECNLVLEGELEVQLGDKIYLLKKDDSITFKSTIPHKRRNPGQIKCVCIGVVSPPWF